jgi:hypothetical protein
MWSAKMDMKYKGLQDQALPRKTRGSAGEAPVDIDLIKKHVAMTREAGKQTMELWLREVDALCALAEASLREA